MPDTDNATEKDLSNRVLQWLKSEGYPVEFAVASVFRKNGFSVRQSEYVMGESDESPREIDVVAYRSLSLGEDLLRVYHVLECKWSGDKPWVVFSAPRKIAPSACIAQTIGSRVGQAVLWAAAGHEELHSLSIFETPPRPGFGGHQAFERQADRFWSAMQAVVSASTSLVTEYDHLKPEKKLYAAVAFPVVVVRGLLFEAYLKDDMSELLLEPVDKARLHWRGAASWRLHATVDVVAENHLSEFVKQRRADIETLEKVLANTLKQLRQCFKVKSLEPLGIKRAGRGRGMPALLAALSRTDPDRNANEAG